MKVKTVVSGNVVQASTITADVKIYSPAPALTILSHKLQWSSSQVVEYRLPTLYSWYGYSSTTSTSDQDYFASVALFTDLACTIPYTDT